MKPQALHVNSIDLIKSLKDSEEPEAVKTACKMALDHLYRGAMDGAKNKPYIQTTKFTYDMLKEMIEKM